jgi:hypothetical protein
MHCRCGTCREDKPPEQNQLVVYLNSGSFFSASLLAPGRVNFLGSVSLNWRIETATL